MKNLLLGISLAITLSLHAQTTVVLRPNAANGKDSEVSNYSANVNSNYGDVGVFASYIWTTGGTPFSEKSLLQFDLTSIPANATITSASLDLYCNNPTTTFVGNPSTPMNGTNNASYVRRITQAWDEHTVTWNNQPTATTTNQIILPTSDSVNQNYLGINVTQLIQDMLTLGNNGFLIEPVATTPSNSMEFKSSDHSDSIHRPQLTITYIVSGCITLRPDAASGKDSEVSNYSANVGSNYGDVGVFASYIWTTGGTPFSEKSLLQFDLTSIPANSTITSASLNLYCNNPTTTFVGNPSTPMNGTNNASYVRRITQAWDEHTVTWNNQPSTTWTNEIILPTSDSVNQNYLDIDVKQLIQDMLTYGNNGFLIEPVSTTPSNSMEFKSSDHSDSIHRPQLTLCYTTETSVNNSINKDLDVRIYPNPFNQEFSIVTNGINEETYVTVSNVMGQLLYNRKFETGTNTITISKDELSCSANLLFVTVKTTQRSKTFKLLTAQ